MAIDPKIGPAHRAPVGNQPAAAAKATPKEVNRDLAAMEPPQTIKNPADARTRPAPPVQGGGGRGAPYDATLARVRADLSQSKPGAGAAALVLASSYAMRRNRRGRGLAQELCSEVAETDPEIGPNALTLRAILKAEGLLTDTDGQATLQACQDLIDLLEAEPS